MRHPAHRLLWRPSALRPATPPMPAITPARLLWQLSLRLLRQPSTAGCRRHRRRHAAHSTQRVPQTRLGRLPLSSALGLVAAVARRSTLHRRCGSSSTRWCTSLRRPCPACRKLRPPVTRKLPARAASRCATGRKQATGRVATSHLTVIAPTASLRRLRQRRRNLRAQPKLVRPPPPSAVGALAAMPPRGSGRRLGWRRGDSMTASEAAKAAAAMARTCRMGFSRPRTWTDLVEQCNSVTHDNGASFLLSPASNCTLSLYKSFPQFCLATSDRRFKHVDC
jgi:hypothetical protein